MTGSNPATSLSFTGNASVLLNYWHTANLCDSAMWKIGGFFSHAHSRVFDSTRIIKAEVRSLIAVFLQCKSFLDKISPTFSKQLFFSLRNLIKSAEQIYPAFRVSQTMGEQEYAESRKNFSFEPFLCELGSISFNKESLNELNGLKANSAGRIIKITLRNRDNRVANILINSHFYDTMSFQS